MPIAVTIKMVSNYIKAACFVSFLTVLLALKLGERNANALKYFEKLYITFFETFSVYLYFQTS